MEVDGPSIDGRADTEVEDHVAHGDQREERDEIAGSCAERPQGTPQQDEASRTPPKYGM